MMRVKEEIFGKLWNKEASLYTLEADAGARLKITNYGGIIKAWELPDKNGINRDIVLGFDSFGEYLAGHPFFGALVGRFANRINKGKFSLDGIDYQLAAQAMGNHLHGGLRGFDKYIWDSKIEKAAHSISLILKHYSEAGNEGYPGALEIEVSYTLYASNTLKISYKASSDKATIINLTNHSYFNLSGEHSKSIASHKIAINSVRYVPVDARQIPTGSLAPLANSYLDCRQKILMQDLFAKAPNKIIDHCYVLADKAGQLRDAVTVEEASTGIRMILATDNVGVQFYNGNKLGSQAKRGKGGILYDNFAGFCLETQCLPDSPNHSSFPSCVLRPGELYLHQAEFRFENFRD